ncbi:L-alanine-DL-glutamate epimerase-like enolase superfamily enzyme [Streptomyces sp. 840.1]|uniref:enolase C-terminal domain-like protein n=1 Tax=Streptomyces sp. 840.1 TaxID=2485152 RepID=UPI000F4A8D0E|nr:enolase C-terminal domain-like protein [Streptomyces sp. 840.1]ROQ70239.1 L-alanine-DL-glutamate epimerase-like enolase superfamily enzyme [Streptomyces sp. 840.1]
MDLGSTVIDRVRVERLDDSVGGPWEAGDSRFAVVVEARGVAGVFAPVDELPAALVATRLGQSVLRHSVTDHTRVLRRLMAELGPHSAGLGRWAVGALDCAVWDLHGRLADLPVAALLSDRPARQVPVYASWLSLDLAATSAAESVKATAGEGFAFTKWALREAEALEMARLAERAATWAGQSVAVDALGTWGHLRAMEVAPLLAPEAVRWVEDPLALTDRCAYTHLRRRAKGLRVAFGERLSHVEDVRALLKHCRPEAFTFDAVWCGGITEALSWLGAAHDAGVPVHLHGRAFLPALHLAAAFPRAAGAVEYQVVWEPRRQRALRGTLQPDGGHVALPDRPGLGMEVRR